MKKLALVFFFLAISSSALAQETARERLFDAIDGTRNVAEIARDWDGDRARAFFERLWWHDHVVFDTSTAL